MTHESDEPPTTWLVAGGSSGRWSVDVDESVEGTKLSLQLDGPQVYLAFAIRELGVIGDALDYLSRRRSSSDELLLGCFDSATVSLHWDNEGSEDTQRCFVIVGNPKGSGALRVTLFPEDITMLIEALRQVVEDISPAA